MLAKLIVIFIFPVFIYEGKILRSALSLNGLEVFIFRNINANWQHLFEGNGFGI